MPVITGPFSMYALWRIDLDAAFKKNFSCKLKRGELVFQITTPATPLTQAYQCGFFYV